MKASLALTILALAVPMVICYDEIYDKIDVNKIIGDESLFTAYIDCMLDDGPCEVEHSEEFKKLLPEVISTSCVKCSPIQKENIRKTVKALSEKKPKKFEEFRTKFDPKGEYEKEFSKFMLGTD